MGGYNDNVIGNYNNKNSCRGQYLLRYPPTPGVSAVKHRSIYSKSACFGVQATLDSSCRCNNRVVRFSTHPQSELHVRSSFSIIESVHKRAAKTRAVVINQSFYRLSPKTSFGEPLSSSFVYIEINIVDIDHCRDYWP